MSNIVIAFDFGTKNIGIAIGQRITNTARPLKTLKVKNRIINWNLIKKIFKEWKPNEIIIGLPLNMDGTEQPITICARKFAKKVYNIFGIQIRFQDERLTTVEARSILFENRGFHALNKDNINSISAVLILESYFNQNLLS